MTSIDRTLPKRFTSVVTVALELRITPLRVKKPSLRWSVVNIKVALSIHFPIENPSYVLSA